MEMQKRRCGVADVAPVPHGRFHTWNSWRNNNLKYHLSFTRRLPVNTQERVRIPDDDFINSTVPALGRVPQSPVVG